MLYHVLQSVRAQQNILGLVTVSDINPPWKIPNSLSCIFDLFILCKEPDNF